MAVVNRMAEDDDGSSTESEYYEEAEEDKVEVIEPLYALKKEPSTAPPQGVGCAVQTAVESTEATAYRIPWNNVLSVYKPFEAKSPAMSVTSTQSKPTLVQTNATQSATTVNDSLLRRGGVSCGIQKPVDSSQSVMPRLERVPVPPGVADTMPTPTSPFVGSSLRCKQCRRALPQTPWSVGADLCAACRTSSRSIVESTSPRTPSRVDERRCRNCEISLPPNYVPGPASTHVECGCCGRWLHPKEWFSESEFRQNYDRRCDRCIKGRCRKRKRGEDEGRRHDAAKKVRQDLPPEPRALERGRKELDAANKEVQVVLKVVRRLVAEEYQKITHLSKPERKQHGMYHPAQHKISLQSTDLKRDWLAFNTKYPKAQQKMLATQERMQMQRYENMLVRRTIESATTEIVVYSFLLKRCNQELPVVVRDFVIKYSKDKGSENAAEELANSLDDLPNLPKAPKELTPLQKTNQELQRVLKIVRQLIVVQWKKVTSLTKAERKNHVLNHPVRAMIIRKHTELKNARQAFKAKSTGALAEEHDQMSHDENELLKQTVEAATIEIIVMAYLLRRCNQELPADVQGVVTEYSTEKGSENAVEELVNSLTAQIPASAAKSQTPATAKVAKPAESLTVTVPADGASSNWSVVEPKSSLKHLPLTECPRCRGRFHLPSSIYHTPVAKNPADKVDSQPESGALKPIRQLACSGCRARVMRAIGHNKRFCDCCVRLLPETRFAGAEWEKRHPIRCLECTGDFDSASIQVFQAIQKDEHDVKRAQALFSVVQQSWVALPKANQPVEEANREVLEDAMLKAYECKIAQLKAYSEQFHSSYRGVTTNDNSKPMMDRDKELYAKQIKALQGERWYLFVKLGVYVARMTERGFGLWGSLRTEVEDFIRQVKAECAARQRAREESEGAVETRPTEKITV